MRALVLLTSVALVFVIFSSAQLIAVVARRIFNPEVFEIEGLFSTLDVPYNLVGDGLGMACFFAFIHAFFVATGYLIWVLWTLWGKDPRVKAEIVPKSLYCSIFGFCAFGAIGTAVRLPHGDFDFIYGGITLLVPIVAPIGMFIGQHFAAGRKDGCRPTEDDVPMVSMAMTVLAIALGVAVHLIVYW